MPITYTREQIRLAVDVVSQENAVDVVSGQTPSMWRGTDLAVEVGFFKDEAGLIDVSVFSSITIEVRDAATRTSVVLATKTLTGSELNNALTMDQWEAGTHQHGIWTWTAAETRWDLQGQLQRDYWLVISAISNDSPPRAITLGATVLTVVEDGAGEPGTSPIPGDPNYLTATETAALMGQVIRPGNNPAGMTILLRSPSGQWGRLIGVSDDGAATDTIIQLT